MKDNHPPVGAPAFCGDFATADIFDALRDRALQIEAPLLHFGGRRRFAGRCSTLLANENPEAIAKAVSEGGAGRILLIDGRAAMDQACLGEIMAKRARDGGWSGVIVLGAIRDSLPIAALDLGVMALRTTAKRPFGCGPTGGRNIPIAIGNCVVEAGAALYVDDDAVLLVADSQ